MDKESKEGLLKALIKLSAKLPFEEKENNETAEKIASGIVYVLTGIGYIMKSVQIKETKGPDTKEADTEDYHH